MNYSDEPEEYNFREPPLLAHAIQYAVAAYCSASRNDQAFTEKLTAAMEVLSIISTMTEDPEVLSAAVLQGVLEDTPCTLEEIRDEFGERIANLSNQEEAGGLVNFLQRKTVGGWYDGKLRQIRALRNEDERMLCLAKHLQTLRRHFDQRKWGQKCFQDMPEEVIKAQAEYYFQVSRALVDLHEYPAWTQFDNLTDLLFGEYSEYEDQLRYFTSVKAEDLKLINLVESKRKLNKAFASADKTQDSEDRKIIRDGLIVGNECFNYYSLEQGVGLVLYAILEDGGLLPSSNSLYTMLFEEQEEMMAREENNEKGYSTDSDVNERNGEYE